MKYKYSNISGIPCVLSVLIGSAYSQDTASIRNLGEKQSKIIADVKLTLSENTWIDDSMITTGEGFSITESEIITENR